MVETIHPKDAAELLAAPGVDIVDVRDEQEWSAGHLPGARVIPLETLRADPEKLLARDATIVFVCAKGVRSLAAAKLAERLGYAHVYSLEGGTKEWARAGLPLIAEQRDRAAA
jgi:rhodanese-related sulfurtransferase